MSRPPSPDSHNSLSDDPGTVHCDVRAPATEGRPHDDSTRRPLRGACAVGGAGVRACQPLA
jgi:hypothetical protein